MATVRYDQATRIFPKAERAAVDGLTLEIADGEFLVLVGPSGCGKSTSLRMLAGLEEVDSGSVYIGDRDVTDLPPKLARRGDGVPELRALPAHDRRREHRLRAQAGARARRPRSGTASPRRRRCSTSRSTSSRKPKALSGGQRQRVAMGRAIVRQPQVFLLDEPLSNLDAKLRVQTRTQIASLQRRLGVTTVYVTHDQVEAMTMGDRVAVLDRGKLQQVDTPRSALHASGEHVRRRLHRLARDEPARGAGRPTATRASTGTTFPSPAPRSGRSTGASCSGSARSRSRWSNGTRDGHRGDGAGGRGARRGRVRLRQPGRPRARQEAGHHRPHRPGRRAGQGQPHQAEDPSRPRPPLRCRNGRAPRGELTRGPAAAHFGCTWHRTRPERTVANRRFAGAFAVAELGCGVTLSFR